MNYHLDHPAQYERALRGELPGEALSVNDRGALVRALVGRGLDDRQIAKVTGWSYLTVVRVRESRHILPAHRERAPEEGAVR